MAKLTKKIQTDLLALMKACQTEKYPRPHMHYSGFSNLAIAYLQDCAPNLLDETDKGNPSLKTVMSDLDNAGIIYTSRKGFMSETPFKSSGKANNLVRTKTDPMNAVNAILNKGKGKGKRKTG